MTALAMSVGKLGYIRTQSLRAYTRQNSGRSWTRSFRTSGEAVSRRFTGVQW